MTDSTEAAKIDVLCRCSGTTTRQIRELVASGVDNPERLSRITGVCSGCGGCEDDVAKLLATLLVRATD